MTRPPLRTTTRSHRSSGRAFTAGRGELRTGAVWTAFGLAAALAVLCAVSGESFSRTVAFLDYGAGVLALVSLTATTLWGLGATDRIMLGPAHRLVAQAVHRGLAVAGLGFLALHVCVKIAAGSTSAAQAALPFTGDSRTPLIGIGTVAGYLFLAVAVTGAVRGAFARAGGSRWWRGLHMGAYVAWGLALVHGLKAGRSASTWVTAVYVLAVVAAITLLALRLAPSRNPPRRPARPAGSGADRPKQEARR